VKVRRVLIAALIAWTVVLAVHSRPEGRAPLHLLHATPLEVPSRDLPTLPPLPSGR
jgi:hypothetical protein